MSMNRETDLLLQSGIAAVRSGDKREGARLLAQVVRKEPQSEDAWFWLAAATDQPAEAAACLRRVLAINPNNARARQALNMLDTGQGQAVFNTGPLEPEANGESAIRPLSTGDLASPYTAPSPTVAPPVQTPPPPPPPFTSNPYGTNPYGTTPYDDEPTVQAAQPGIPPAQPPVPSTPPPFAWTSTPNGEVPADPYSVNTMPSPAPGQSNMPPPPPFTGGGVRLGQLDPNATVPPNIPPAQGPATFDPGAELRASLLPTTPANAVPPPPGATTIVVKKKRRVNPVLLVLALVALLLLVALVVFLLTQNNPSNQVATVSSADQTATAASGLTATATAQGTPGASNGTPGAGANTTPGAKGTPGVSGNPGANGSPGANSTPGANTTPGASGTPGSAANGTPGSAANGTPGASGTSGTGPNGSGGTLPAGTVLPGQPTPTAPAGSQPGTNPGTGTGVTSGANTTPGGTGGEFPGNNGTPGTPTVVPGLGTDVPPPTVRDNRPPPEVVEYVNNTAAYINTAQFYETAVFQGIIAPYRAGRIKPGVTRINIPAFTIPTSDLNQIAPASVFSATIGAGANASPTPVPSATAGGAAGASSANASGTPGVTGSASGTPGNTPANAPSGPTPTAIGLSTASANTGTSTTPGALPPGVPPYAQKVIINGPNGPEVGYLVDFNGEFDMNRMTLSLGQVARVIKDQPVPAGAYELNLVSVEYANDLSNMANAMDMFFQSGKISYLDDLSSYYDKAVRDRDRWAQIVANGYPFHIIL